jgi:hypothetical protein
MGIPEDKAKENPDRISANILFSFREKKKKKQFPAVRGHARSLFFFFFFWWSSCLFGQ